MLKTALLHSECSKILMRAIEPHEKENNGRNKNDELNEAEPDREEC